MEKIYIRFKGRVLGPISGEKALEMARRGQITRQHEVSPDGLTWQAAANVPELFPARGEPQGTSAQENHSNTAPPSNGSWFANFDGSNQGPTDDEGIKQWIGMGKITRSTLVWRDGMSTWAEAGVAQPSWFVGVPVAQAFPFQGNAGVEANPYAAVTSNAANYERSSTVSNNASQETNVLAIISLIAGILALTIGCCCWTHIPLGLTAVICGILGIVKANTLGSGFGMALSGIICGGLALILITALSLLGLAINLANLPR